MDWQNIPDLANIGYPIVEAEPDGSFTVTKHPGTGGRIDSHGVKEQLLYEIGDPRQYMTPDCVADFTSLHLEDTGPDRVRGSGVRGGPRPAMLKASISYHAGWKASGTLVYSWPDALEKARVADRITRQRLDQLGLRFDEIYTEYFGVNACHGPAAHPVADPTGSAGAHQRARPRQARRRSLHARNDSAGAHRPARRHRLWRRPARGAPDRGLLAGPDSAR